MEKRQNGQKLEPMKYEWTNWLTCELINDWAEAEKEYDRLKKNLGPKQMIYSIEVVFAHSIILFDQTFI